MADDLALESLLVQLLHHVGEQLPRHSVVKGGLVLRLLDCPRRTNDLDVVLIPFGSKRDAVPLFHKALESFPCDALDVQVHSTAIRARIHKNGLIAQVEASVAEECPATALSTSPLARLHQLQPRVVQVMRFDIALSNKLGAWLERALLRDLFDIAYWVGIQRVHPDEKTLNRRLHAVRDRKGKSRPWTREELAAKLETQATALNDDDLRAELHAVMPEEEFSGLAARMRGYLLPFAAWLARTPPLEG
jgi:hypothetical protein